MRIGHRFSVSIEGHPVGEAVVEDIEDNVATIVIPQTRVRMTLATSLVGPSTGDSERVVSGLNENHLESGTSEAAREQQQNVSEPEPQLKSDDVGEGIHGRKLDSSALD